MKRADTSVTFLKGVFKGHFLDIVVVDLRVRLLQQPSDLAAYTP